MSQKLLLRMKRIQSLFIITVVTRSSTYASSSIAAYVDELNLY